MPDWYLDWLLFGLPGNRMPGNQVPGNREVPSNREVPGNRALPRRLGALVSQQISRVYRKDIHPRDQG